LYFNKKLIFIPNFMLLQSLDIPADLRLLQATQLPQVCEELRHFIIEQVAIYGGHLGASLGVVELTVALHYVFNTPDDKLIWDVGHQAYGHKILTGRRDIFPTNRKLNGISGFPKRSESQYDAFGVGHSSTSISAALGMAMAAQLSQNLDRQHIAVIGDGAMTAGMAYEGINHAGGLVNSPNLLIILNDNGMSIDKNVGALHNYFSKTFQTIPKNISNTNTQNIKNSFCEIFNLEFIGSVDGHNIENLLEILHLAKNQKGVRLIHCQTTKGKGYTVAESDQITWHAPGLFDKVTGKIHKKVTTEPQSPKYQDVFGHSLVELAKINEKIIGITPAMLSGSSMQIMAEHFPTRTFDVGIAEQHAVTLAAGFACENFVPFCNIYATFLQRAYDQVIHDVCLQNLKVVFCLDRAGLVGADGATHHGVFDIAFLRCIPNIIVAAPMNEIELRNMLYTAQLPQTQTAIAIRYPRGQGVTPNWKQEFLAIEIGKGRCIAAGKDTKIAILSFGHIGNKVVNACTKLATENIFPAHYDMRFAKPLDSEILKNLEDYTIITIEDACKIGGFGSAVVEFFAEKNSKNKIICLGIEDTFVEHAEPEELYTITNLSVENIIKIVKQEFQEFQNY
jgi:1-deoxy-D-xylulose-5-phosphate synthase